MLRLGLFRLKTRWLASTVFFIFYSIIITALFNSLDSSLVWLYLSGLVSLVLLFGVYMWSMDNKQLDTLNNIRIKGNLPIKDKKSFGAYLISLWD